MSTIHTENTGESNILSADSIVEGTVSGITSFGAFVKLPGGVEGLVHISEIANEYVTNIENYVTLGETIKVKVLGRNDRGKYDLSIKKVEGNKPPSVKNESEEQVSSPSGPSSPKRTMSNKVGRYRKIDKANLNPFEEKMMNFLKKSEEKLIDLKRNIQTKQGVKKRKKR